MRGVPRKGLCELAGEPSCGRMLPDIQMQNLPSRVAEDHAHLQQTKRSRDDHKYIDRGDAVDLIAQEAPPGRRRLTMAPDHMSPDGCLADSDAQLEHLAVNPWCTP